MRKFLYLFVVIGLAGCTDGLGVGLDSDVRGTYSLYSVNGQRLPYEYSSQFGIPTRITAGTLRLESDGYFTESLQLEENDFGRISRYYEDYPGFYEVGSRGEVTLYYDDGAVYDAEYSSRELRIYGDGQTVVYRR